MVTQLKEKYGPYVDNVEEMGEKLLQGTLNICDINLPNMQILGNGKALRRALPAKIPWSFPLLVTPLAIKELDNRFTGVTSISNINLNEFESSVGNIKNKLNKDIESPFNKVNEVIKSKKRTINPPDLGIISQLKEERVEKVSDVVSEGDVVKVKVLDIDSRGKVKLSMKEADTE